MSIKCQVLPYITAIRDIVATFKMRGNLLCRAFSSGARECACGIISAGATSAPRKGIAVLAYRQPASHVTRTFALERIQLSRDWKAIPGAQDLGCHRHQNKKSYDNEGDTQKAERKPAVVRLFDGGHGVLPWSHPLNV